MIRASLRRCPPFSHWPHHVYRRKASTRSQARIERILNRLPKYLRPYARDLRTAPLSHIFSFLILHEVTAILPLVGLTAGFHYAGWSPQIWIKGTWIEDRMEKFGKYFNKKRWFGFTQDERDTSDKAKKIELEQNDIDTAMDPKKGVVEWSTVVNKENFLAQVATAYAVTKILLPVRIVVSVWMTPWFARKVIGRIKKIFTNS